MSFAEKDLVVQPHHPRPWRPRRHRRHRTRSARRLARSSSAQSSSVRSSSVRSSAVRSSAAHSQSTDPGTPAEEAPEEDLDSLEGPGLLKLIVALLTKPASKGIKVTPHEVQLSARVRKAMAAYSYETLPGPRPGVLTERGVKPTLRQLKQAVADASGRWPWAPTSEAPLNALRRARTDYLAKKFDDVSLAGSALRNRNVTLRMPGKVPASGNTSCIKSFHINTNTLRLFVG